MSEYFEEDEDANSTLDDLRGEDLKKRRPTYSERVRDWGERTAQARRPESEQSSFVGELGAASRSLAPPVRRVSTVVRDGGGDVADPSSNVNAPSMPTISSESLPGGLSSKPSLLSIPENHAPAMPTRHVSGAVSATPLRQPSRLASSRYRSGAFQGTAPSHRGQQSILKPGGVSLFQGQNLKVRLSVLPSTNVPQEQFRSDPPRTQSFAPRRLLDIESGKSIVVTDQKFWSDTRFQPLGEDGAIIVAASKTAPFARSNAEFWSERGSSLEDKLSRGSIRDFSANSEVTMIGAWWRAVLRQLLVATYDQVNALRLTRALQLFLPFQTGYETYILGQLLEALEKGRKKDIQYTLKVAFSNRNVSRILVQVIGPRQDWLWHWSTQITWSRLFDMWGQLPIIGITGFPATENFPSTRNHVLASIFRVALGEGAWITRVVTRGREGLQTDNPKNTAQNLAAESNGFELANRNQFGTYVGRRKTNQFRYNHRLPTDESVVRTFIAQPMPTMLNNGVVHVLRDLAKHWHNMLYQFSGNFAHQRMEQLDPFETLRFHMPVVLLTLSSLRGRNRWDTQVLGPMVRKLQQLKPSSTADTARYLIRELQEDIVVNVCGGVASMVDPFFSWLDAMNESCSMVEEEALEVYDMVSSVEIGIRLGHDLITQVSWKIPSDAELKKAILNHIRGLSTGDVQQNRIRTAMTLITPRDKRTLIELVNNGLVKSKPAQLLLGRAKTLLQREMRREMLNETIRELSRGDAVEDVEHDEWYWLELGNDSSAEVYIYDAKVTGQDLHRFVHVDTGFEKFVSLTDGNAKCIAYVPVAEAICRAQRAFMNIELDHGKKFSYDAFMEFTFLRTALRRLVVISQMTCEELDKARLNVLAEVQRSNQGQVSIHDLEPGKTYYTYDSNAKEYKRFVCEKKYTATDPEWATLARTKIVRVPPQSMIVVGGGPTGLMTTIHCTEAVLTSGGVMKLYEARDAFAKGGSTFERAQIVRLDARWIAMLRYHLGTGFEDVYIPASGETDSQLGNTLPTQGFVEITIKDLENMLHVEVSKMWSKGLLAVHTDAKANYDPVSNSLTKLGEHLKLDDSILRRVDEEGRITNAYHTWKITEVQYADSLNVSDLRIGEEYGVYVHLENSVLPYKLMGIDLRTETYTFSSARQAGKPDIQVHISAMPYVYPKGVDKHAEISKLIVESVKKGSRGGYARESLLMKVIKKERFTLDIGHTHVVECIGKPLGSKVHFSVTTYEPYGVCCIQGLKISMGMHNFGEKRWGSGILDDIRSQTDQNTRIIGDFTKMVRSAPATQKMYEYITDKKNKDWQLNFTQLTIDAGFPELNDFDPVVPKIQKACLELATNAPSFRRQTLQTRFFETGDNYYLGMEFMREYDKWKIDLVEDLVGPLTLKAKDDAMRKKVDRFKGTLNHHIDRLWYDGVLEVIRTGDVYNPGARHRVPRLYLINSYTDAKLGNLPVGESFRLSNNPKEKYEVVIIQTSQVIVRNVEGFISKMPKSTMVKREGNLTRGPDGNAESRVSLATFPVGHYVNFRTARLNDSEKGYLFAFIGDEQATPHFMRYSGLTGACINAMLFNNFIKQANDGIPFIDRFRLYSIETNWSNGEVVQRGTGSNYGEDGFLRPGFSYDHGLDYLYSKVIEYRESEQDLDNILSRDWKIKLAASMVPRGMELNEKFIQALREKLHQAVFNKFVKEAKADKVIGSDELESALNARGEAIADQREALDYESYWDMFLSGLNIDRESKIVLSDPYIFIAKRLDQICNQIIEFATKAYLFNERISSELSNQPKPVDSILDDFAAEAQNFANALTMSAAFSSGALAFTLLGDRIGIIFGAILAGINIAISFGSMTNVSRYKIRNEEARAIFYEEKMLGVLKGVFSVMDRQQQDSVPMEKNPFVIVLQRQMAIFEEGVKYRDSEDPAELREAYMKLMSSINDPEAIRAFQNLLAAKFIADVYHVNSYLQQYLVDIYKTLEDMHRLLTAQVNRSTRGNDARRLFDRLSEFRGKLKDSLQLGPARFGFLKKRRITQWDITVVFKYFYSLLCCASRSGAPPTAPISIQTLSLVKETRYVSSMHESVILRREIRDMEGLYWATRESDRASLIFMSAFLVFIASILFTIAQIFRINVLLSIAFWASLPSTIGAIIATFHLWRKFLILFKLMITLDSKIRGAPSSADRDSIRTVRRVTFTQILLTLTRLASAGAAAVALPWSIAVRQFPDDVSTSSDIPFWIALGAVCTAIGATVFFFLVEFWVRYRLNPKLGEFVCESFRDEIETMFKVLSLPINDIDTKQVQDHETWEYVAREFLHRYRFDTVFAADRFGSILQYIQSGMDPRG